MTLGAPQNDAPRTILEALQIESMGTRWGFPGSYCFASPAMYRANASVCSILAECVQGL